MVTVQINGELEKEVRVYMENIGMRNESPGIVIRSLVRIALKHVNGGAPQ